MERDQWLTAAVKVAPSGQKDGTAGLGGGLTSRWAGQPPEQGSDPRKAGSPQVTLKR